MILFTDNYTVYIDHDKKKHRVRQGMPDKNTKQQSSRKKLKLRA